MLRFRAQRDLKELTENGKLNDFIILENYLDQCVKLRLGQGVHNLKEAHDISTIITSKKGVNFNIIYNLLRNVWNFESKV